MHRIDPHSAQRAKSTSTSTKLPKYLLLRGTTFYFKRRVPRGLEHAFPEAPSGQLWKSLDTDLMSKATVMLEAERAQFELRVAAARQAQAEERKRNLERHAPAVTVAAGPADGSKSQPSTVREERASATRVTPVTPPPAQAAKAQVVSAGGEYTLHHLLAAWKQTQTRHRTINAYTTAVDEFHQLHGSIAARHITREHARRYRDRLVERKLSRGTVANRIGFLKTLIRFGQQELIEDVVGNPFERVPVLTASRLRAPKERRAFTVAELNRLFQHRVFTEGHRPRGQVGEAAFWAPLLGPFVGARLEEVAQLRAADIECVNGAWCIRITDHGEGQHLKTLSSHRRVPVHQELVRCGFLWFVQQQRAAGHARLFPTLSNKNANRTWSNALGKWFARLLDEVGLSDTALDYHSLRYTFKQQCSLCNIPNEARDALVGHWVGRSDGGRVYLRAEDRQYPLPLLVDAMKKLRYSELKLQHLHVANATTAKVRRPSHDARG